MPIWPETQATLIARLRDPDDQRTWDEFVRLYRPAIYRFARGQGLQDADAQDVTQKVLLAISQAAERWQPDESRGKFRAWLAQITRNAVINVVTRDARKRGSGRSSIAQALAETPACEDADEQWRKEKQIQRYRAAAEIVQPQCTATVWQAFYLTAVQDKPIDQTASELGVSVGVVYAARSRVLKRLRAAAQQIEQDETSEVENR